jgi:hypothetical protein
MHVSATILLVFCILLLPPLRFCINCPSERVELDLSHPPPPHSSNLSSTDFSADRQCLGGGGRIGVRGLDCPAPTTQAGRVTFSVWEGGGLGSGGWAAPLPCHKGEGGGD